MNWIKLHLLILSLCPGKVSMSVSVLFVCVC